MSLDYAYYYDTVLTEANSSHYFSLGYQWPNVIVQQPKVDFVIPETKDAGVDPQMYFLDDLDVQTSLNMLDQNKLPEKSSKKKH